MEQVEATTCRFAPTPFSLFSSHPIASNLEQSLFIALPQPKLQILCTNNCHDLYFVALDPKVKMVAATAAATIAKPDVVDGLVYTRHP